MKELDAALREMQEAVRSAVRERKRRTESKPDVVELDVQPEARQVGVGATLLAPTVSWAASRGCDGIDAVARPGDRATKNFFESHGLVARAIIAHLSLDGIPPASP